MGTDDDNDRAAILARRQRFIALALSGLACTSTEPASRDAKPNACLEYSVEPRPKPDPAPDAMPGPCLAVPIGEGPEPDPPKVEPPKPETDTANPNVCLSIAPPEPPPPTTGAAPCLSAVPPKHKPKPKPAKPVPCLEFAAPSDDET